MGVAVFPSGISAVRGGDPPSSWLSASQSSIVNSELAMDIRVPGLIMASPSPKSGGGTCCWACRGLARRVGELGPAEGGGDGAVGLNSKSSSQFSDGSTGAPVSSERLFLNFATNTHQTCC